MLWRLLCLLLLQVVRSHVSVMLCSEMNRFQCSSLHKSSYILTTRLRKENEPQIYSGIRSEVCTQHMHRKITCFMEKERTIVSLTVNWQLFFSTKLKSLWYNWQKDSSIHSNGFYYIIKKNLQKRLYFIISLSTKLQLYFKMQRKTKNISIARTVFALFLKK